METPWGLSLTATVTVQPFKFTEGKLATAPGPGRPPSQCRQLELRQSVSPSSGPAGGTDTARSDVVTQ